MSLRVSDVIGLDRLRALRAEGKDNAAIMEEVNKVLDPIKKNIGEDVYTSFSSRGISFSKMKEYAEYQAKKAADAAKAAEEKYAKDVAYAKEEFKKEYGGTDFVDRVRRGATRVFSELDVATHNLAGAKPDSQVVGFLEANDEIAAAWEKAHRTPEEQKIYREKEKAFSDAKGTVDTIATGADMLWQKVKNPSEWDMAGLMTYIASPINLAGGAAGAAVTKALAETALKTGAKLAAGTGTSAAVNAGVWYGHDYNVQKGRGRSDEEATKVATLGLAANVAMGAGMGAVTSILAHRFSARKEATSDTTPKENPQSADTTLGVEGEKAPDKTFSMMDGTVIGKDEFDAMSANDVLDTLDQYQKVMPKELQDSALMKISGEAEVHSAKASEVIKKIDETTPDFAEREAKVAKYAPPTELETFVNGALNEGEVAPSMYGNRARNKLEISIANADMISMEHITQKLDEYGIVGEHKAVMLDAYARRDIDYYNQWAAAKIEQKGESDANIHAGDKREDPRIQEDRSDLVNAGARETVEPDTKPEALPESKPRDTENLTDTGRDPGNLDTKDGVPTQHEGVDGHRPLSEDDGTLPRDRGNDLVQNEDGARIDGEVETPTKPKEYNNRKLGLSIAKAESKYDDISIANIALSNLEKGDTFTLNRVEYRVKTITDKTLSLSDKEGTTTYKIDSPKMETLARDIAGEITAGYHGVKSGKALQDIAYRDPSIQRDDRGILFSNDVFGEQKALKSDETLPRDRGNDLVQNEDGARVDGEVETPTQTYARIKDEPAISGEEKARIRKLSENYEIEMLSQSDGVIQKLDSGFELKSYPLREKAIDDMRAGIASKNLNIAKVNDPDIVSVFNFKHPEDVTRKYNASDLNKIFNHHADSRSENLRGQLAITNKDIAAYPDIAESFDQRIFTQAQNGEKSIVSAKQINGHYVVIEEVSDKKSSLNLKSIWKMKGDLKDNTLKPRSGESLILTSKTSPGYEPDISMSSPLDAADKVTPLSAKSIADDTGNVKNRNELLSHRYYEDMVTMVKAEKAKESERVKRVTPSDKRVELEKLGWDKSEDRYKAEMKKFFKKSRDPVEKNFNTYTKAEMKKIESGKIDKALAPKLKEDLQAYAANPTFAQQRAEIDGGYRSFADEAAILREMEADERLNLVESETFRAGYDDPNSGVDTVVSVVDRLSLNRGDEAKFDQGMRPGFVGINPLETIFIDVPGVFNTMKNKLDKIVSDKVTGKIKNTKVDDFLRKFLLADMNGFGGLSRKASDALVKQFRKLQASLAKSNISAENKASLISDFKKSMRDELFHGVTIQYLENPAVRAKVKEVMPDMAKQLDVIRKAISKNSEDLMSRGLLLPSQYEKWKDNFLSRLYMVEADSKGVNISNGIKQAEIKSGRKIDSIMDYLREHPKEADRLGVVLDSELMIKTTISKAEGNVGIDDFFRGILDMPETIGGDLLVKMPNKISNLPEKFSPTYAEKVVIPYIDDLMRIESRKMVDGLFAEESIMEVVKKEFKRLESIKKELQGQVGTVRYAIDNFEEKGKVKIPDDKRYGVLAGLPIEQDIASMVKSQFKILHEPEMFANRLDKYGSQLLAYFKWAKVPANIFAYPRNLQGNFFQWSMSGANPVAFFKEYPLAIDSFVRKDKWYEMARENGMLNTNVMSEEVNNVLKGVSDSIKGNTKKEKLHKATLEGMQKIGNYYGLVDDLAKIARMKYAIEKDGLNVFDAINKAQETHYDYSLTYDVIRKMRNPDMTEGSVLKIIGTLFPTYTQKTISFLYDTMIHRPVTLASIGAGLAMYIKGNEEEAREEIGSKRYDEVMANLPDWVKDNPFSRIDMKKVNGKVEVTITDLGYTIPFGSVVSAGMNLASGEPAKAAGQIGLGGSPLQMVGDLVNNKDSFTGKEIYFDYDGTQKTKDVAAYLTKQFAPGTLTRIYSLTETKHPVIPRLVGINTYVYSAEELAKYNGYAKMKQKRSAGMRAVKFKRKIEQAYKDYKVKEITKEKYLQIKKENEAEIARWKELGGEGKQ